MTRNSDAFKTEVYWNPFESVAINRGLKTTATLSTLIQHSRKICYKSEQSKAVEMRLNGQLIHQQFLLVYTITYTFY